MSQTNTLSTSELIVKGLNTAQAQAVLHDSGPLAVLAGPGTGKTRVIVHRIAHMLAERHVLPESIVAVTFTVKAAQQMRERLARTLEECKMDPELAVRVGVYTFHGLGLRMIRRFRDVLGLPAEVELTDIPQQRRLLRKLIVQHKLMPQAIAGGVAAAAADALSTFGFFYEQAMDPDAAKAAADHWLEIASNAANYEDRQAHEAALLKAERFAQITQLFSFYHERCIAKGQLSFGDLVLQPVRLLRDSARARTLVRDEYRHWVVDEFQDVSPAQIELLKLIAPTAKVAGISREPDLCVVGDDDQAIYGFRGADDRAFEKFAIAWPIHTQVKLTENYRSAKPIVGAANSIITKAISRFAPDKLINAAGTFLDHPPITLVRLVDEKENAEAVARAILIDRATRPGAKFDDIAVIVRTNGELDRVARRLQLEGVPIRMVKALSWREDLGVDTVLTWINLLCDGVRSYEATKLLRGVPFDIPLEVSSRWQELYAGVLSRHEAHSLEFFHPGSFVKWLRGHLQREQDLKADDHAAALRFADEHDRFAKIVADQPASVMIFELVRHVESASAIMLGARERKTRIEALLSLQRLAGAKQDRLEAPGRLPDFLSYWADLPAGDDGIDPEDQVDSEGQPSSTLAPGTTPAEAIAASGQRDAVTVLTAHTAKGLEFHTVFVVRVNSANGFPFGSNKSDPLVLPPHLQVDARGLPIDPLARRQDEERRLFYVAATRAMHRLIIQSKLPKTKSKTVNYALELLDSATKNPIGIPLVDMEIETLRQRTRAADVVMASDLWSDADLAAGGSVPATVDDLYRAVSRGIRRRAALAFDGIEDVGALVRQAKRDEPAPDENSDDTGDIASGLAAIGGGSAADGTAMEQAVEPVGRLARLLASCSHIKRTGELPEWAAGLPDAMKLELQRYHQRHAVLVAGGKVIGDDDPLKLIFTPRKGPLNLSYSAFQSFERCPRCHYIAEKYGIRSPQSQKQILGIVAHDAMEMFYKHWTNKDAAGAALPALPDLLALGRKAFFSRLPDDQPADQGELQQLDAQLTLCFERLHDPRAHVLELEMNINMPLEACGTFHRLTARIDRIDLISPGNYRVIDYKTGFPSKKLLEPKAKDTLQFGIYALAIDHQFNNGLPVGGTAEFWVLSSGQKGVLDLGQIDREAVKAELEEAIGKMLNGPYPRGSNCWGVCQIIGSADA